MIDDGKLELLQEMYKTWPFFGVTLDMIEMVFAKVRTPEGFGFLPFCVVERFGRCYDLGSSLRHNHPVGSFPKKPDIP